MKRIHDIFKLILVIGIIGTFSCTEEFGEINTDPNSYNEAPPELLFPGVVRATLDHIGGDMNVNMYLNYANYIGGKGGQVPKYGWYSSITDRFWRVCYVDILKNLQEIIDNYAEDPDRSNQVHIAKIWKSYVYSVMVSTWGGVPFDDALGDKNIVPYNTEEEVYTRILTMLKEAAEGIDPAGDKLSNDPVFDGDNDLWIKFANTLRLKLALRISHGFPALAEEHGRAAMADETALVSSNADNVHPRWGTEQENWSWYYDLLFYDDRREHWPFINHTFLLHLKTYDDPRMDEFVDPALNPLLIQDTIFASGSTTEKVVVKYGIPYYGKTLGSTSMSAWDLQGTDNIMSEVPGDDYSLPDQDNFLAQDMYWSIISFAQTNFMKAEAVLKGWGGSKTAEEYYYAGIDASMVQYGVAGGAAAYKAQDGIAWGTASKGDRDLPGLLTSGISDDPMDKIARQRWLASFFFGHDPWCLQKRTRLLPWPPHFNADVTASEYNFAVTPERHRYSLFEEAISPAEYATALANLGGPDEMWTPLKMNKPYDFYDYENEPVGTVEYNQEFARHWYGDSEDDLIAEGVDYEILETLK